MSSSRMLLAAALTCAGLIIGGAGASAAGFFLNEQSVTASGRAFAGVSAATDDAGIIAYNPAGMTELGSARAGIGGYAIIPHAVINDTGSSLMIGPFGPYPVAGDSEGQGFRAQPTGYFYAAIPLSSDLWMGMAVTAPFGLKARYSTDFFGRYDSIKSSLVVVQIAPSVAYRVNDYVSVGASINIQRADATLTTALPNPLDPMGPNPASDGLLTVKGNDWSTGFSVGLHVRPTDMLDLGVTYRSGVTHTLSGTSTTDFGGMQTSMGASARVRLPDIVSAGLAFRALDNVTLLAEVSHFGWKRFRELRLVFEDSSESATTENFRNTWAITGGAEVAVGSLLNVRAGLEYDQTPTVDAHRSTRIPDTDRLWLTAGLSYLLSDRWRVDASYAHLISKSAPLNRIDDFPALSTTVTTLATTETSSNVLGLGLQARF